MLANDRGVPAYHWVVSDISNQKTSTIECMFHKFCQECIKYNPKWNYLAWNMNSWDIRFKTSNNTLYSAPISVYGHSQRTIEQLLLRYGKGIIPKEINVYFYIQKDSNLSM